MGDMGIDKWFWRMEEHQQKGDAIIEHDPGQKTDTERLLILKNRRANFWEKNQRMPTHDELNSSGAET